MSPKTRLSVLCISTPVLAFVIVGGLMGKEPTGEQTFQHLRVFDDVVSLVMNSYVGEVKPERVMDGAMRGLADGLDPDSAYLDAQQVRAMDGGEAPTEGDVGVEFTRQYYLRVIAARAGSPAAKAGLQTGDTVRAIDGRPTRDMSVFEGMRMLRGKPGSKVTLTVLRSSAADPHDIVLVREKSSGPWVTSRMIGSDIGYLRVIAFRGGVADDLRRLGAELARSGARTFVVDVRGTAEGTYENGLDSARLFVKTGTLAIKTTRGGESARERIQARPGDGAIDAPVTLLVTTGTAGAAELFVAALEGNQRADLIGERTLGRAGLQKLVRLPEGRGLWLTYARYLTPRGDAIQGRGIEPDVPVEEPTVEFGAAASTTDAILDAAIARIRTKAAA